MGVARSAAAVRLDVLAGRMKVPASQRGVIALNGTGDRSTTAVPVVSTERSAMTPTATRPSAASPSDPNEPNPIRTGGVVRRLPSPIPLPAKFSLEPGAFGGIETPLATNGSTVFAAVNGYLYAFNAATGAILLKTPLSSGTNAPVAIHGDYVIAGAGVQVPKSNKQLIIAYILGAKGKFPDTVGS